MYSQSNNDYYWIIIIVISPLTSLDHQTNLPHNLGIKATSIEDHRSVNLKNKGQDDVTLCLL